jgi:hypothetical protein
VFSRDVHDVRARIKVKDGGALVERFGISKCFAIIIDEPIVVLLELDS